MQKCSVQTTIIRAAMSEYRFHLQKYRYGSKISCPNCGKSRCFVRYVDEEGIIRFPGTVGKCDHENSCGYHYTPREYFRDNPDVLSQTDGGRADRCILPRAAERETPHPDPSFISADVVARSLSHYEINPLYCSGYTTSAPHPNGAALPSSGRLTGRDRCGPGKSCCTIPLPGIG